MKTSYNLQLKKTVLAPWAHYALAALLAGAVTEPARAQNKATEADLEIVSSSAQSGVRLDPAAMSTAANILIDRAALAKALAPWTGRDLSAIELEQATAATVKHLRSSGHTQARVVVRREGVAGVRVMLEGLSPTAQAYAEVKAVEPVIDIRSIRVQGTQSLTPAQLEDAVKPWVGQTLNASQLQAPAKAVTDLLKAKGFSLAQAIVPPQPVNNGELIIQVVEGVIDGSVGINGVKITGVTRTEAQVIADIIAPGAPAGQPVRVEQLEPRLILANELPGLRLKASLVPGQVPGSTAIEINAEEEKANSAMVYIDNHGSRFSGQARLGADLDIYSPRGRGDLISLGGVATDGSQSGKLAWSGLTGWRDSRLGLSLSASRSELTPQIINARFDGSSTVLSLFGQMPMKRSAGESLSAVGSLDFKNLNNKFEDMLLDKREMASVSAGLTGAFATGDRFGQVRWASSVTVGQVKLVDELISLSPRMDTQGHFSKLSLNYSLTRPMSQEGVAKDWTFQLRGTGQLHLNGANLDNAEKFALGGPDGVRGYPVGEGSGDSGYLLSMEFSRALPVTSYKAAKAFFFVDTGGVTRNPNPAQAAEASDGVGNTLRLHSVGLGLKLDVNNRTALQFTLANQVGSNPGRVNGLDSDAKSSNTRLWLTGTSRF